jgi:hypothetical protein
MKRFIQRIGSFSLLVILLITAGLCLPVTPRASKSLLFASVFKNRLLRNTDGPRLIFVGGSNLSFGLDSEAVENNLNLHVINTAIHAKLGLNYMLTNTLQFIKEGDIVILAPEYQLFFDDPNVVSEELSRLILDVDPTYFKLLTGLQKFRLIGWVPKYAFSKFKPSEYYGALESDVHSVNAFNKFGDVFAHWDLKPRPFKPFPAIEREVNAAILDDIIEFNLDVREKGGRLFFSFPCLQEQSFNNSRRYIEKVLEAVKQRELPILGSPERYMMPSELMFDSPYHLTRKGVERRTALFIEDFRSLKPRD